jgi:hypothetical protein
VANIQIYLHEIFYIFLRSLNIYFYFIFSPAWKFKWKRNSKKGKTSQAVFLRAGLLLKCLGPSPRVSRPASCYHTAVTDRQGQPVGAVFPQSPLLRACVTSPAEFLSSSRPHVECSHHLNAHLSTCHHEPSHRLLMLWSIVSMLLATLLSPVAALAGMPVPGARRQSLTSPAPLAKLTQLKSASSRPMDTWMPPVQLTTPKTMYRQTQLACPSHGSLCRCTSAPCEHTRSIAALSQHLISSLLAQNTLLLCNPRL